MSLARALTTRLRRHAASSQPSTPGATTDENAMVKRMASVVDRAKISSPVELISSTNMLTYDAPDVSTIRQQRQASSSSSAASTNSSSAADDSDASSTNDTSRNSNDLTDASSVEASPCEPNHLSCYFDAAQDATTTPKKSSETSLRRSATSAAAGAKPDALAPAIPQRALSHSKSSHIALARKRSLQSIRSTSSPRSTSLSRSNSLRDSTATIATSPSTPSDHPFGRELEKLSEVVEELGGYLRDAEDEEDAAVMGARGLCRWTADEYLTELSPLYAAGFAAGNHPATMVPAWI